MSRNGAATAAKPQHEKKPDDFRYGWRYVKRIGRDGEELLDQVPLTLEDVLHPQEEDVIAENTVHSDERIQVSLVFKTRTGRLRRARVFTDCLIDWGVPGVKNHSPDISVFEEVADPEQAWGTFPMRAQGAEPLLAMEIVSPHTRKNDVVFKVAEYHQVRIPLYIIVDWEREDGPRRLIGYRWTAQRYVRMRLDRQGRLLIESLGLRLGLVDDRLVCYDAVTDEVIGDYGQITEALEAAEAARLAAEAARLAAETARQEEAAARLAAEARIRALEEQLRQSRRQEG